jgi:hypothetical protein
LIDWEKHVYDEEEKLKDIPDLVKMDELRFYFKLTNWFLTGIERGLYNDTSLIINSDCFGDQFVTKINEFEYIVTADPFGDPINNVVPVISLVY